MFNIFLKKVNYYNLGVINKRMQNIYQQLSSIKHSVETCGVANTFALRPWNYDTRNRVID